MKNKEINSFSLPASSITGGSSKSKRPENEFYSTDPQAVRALLNTGIIEGNSFREPCCANGNISQVLKEYFPEATHYNHDLVPRNNYSIGEVDFMKQPLSIFHESDWIISNPPFSFAEDFIKRSMTISNTGVAMFLKVVFVTGSKRQEWLFGGSGLKYIYVFGGRTGVFPNNKRINPATGKRWASAVNYAWYIFENAFKGEPTIRALK